MTETFNMRYYTTKFLISTGHTQFVKSRRCRSDRHVIPVVGEAIEVALSCTAGK